MRKRSIHVLHGSFAHITPMGDVLWQSGMVDNILHDEGEQYLLAQSFANTRTGFTHVDTMYMGLDLRTALAEEDNLTTVDTQGEPKSKSGYSRISISATGTGAAGQPFVFASTSTYWQAQGTTVTWTAGELWTSVSKLFMCTTNTGTASVGKLVCSLALTATRTLQSGDTLNASMYIGMSEA